MTSELLSRCGTVTPSVIACLTERIVMAPTPLGITLKATANELQVSKNQVSEAREDRLFDDWPVA